MTFENAVNKYRLYGRQASKSPAKVTGADKLPHRARLLELAADDKNIHLSRSIFPIYHSDPQRFLDISPGIHDSRHNHGTP